MIRFALLPVLATLALGAQAQHPRHVAYPDAPASFVDRARVQNVEPQYESVQVPRNECSSQWVQEPRYSGGGAGYGGAIIGGVAGGILGNQVGKGSGREAATAAGAVIGAIAGDRIANREPAPHGYAQREVRTCRTVYDLQQRLNGYRVTYEYRGQIYSTVTREEPGRTLPVRVSVTPLEERDARYNY